MAKFQLLIAVAIIAIFSSFDASAQTVAWKTRVKTQVPAGSLVRTMNPVHGYTYGSSAVSLLSYEIYDVGDLQYRVMAIDTADGSLKWSRDLGDAFAVVDYPYGMVVPLPNGDVIVSVNATHEINRLFAQVMRLRGSDGEVVWSRTERISGTSIGVYALVLGADGNILATGRVGSNARTLRLNVENGATLWEREVVAEPGHSLRGVAIVSGENDASVLQVVSTPPPGGATSLALLGLSTSSGNVLWSSTHCSGGASLVYQGNTDDVRLRMLGDSSVEFVSRCWNSGEQLIELGRLNSQTGAPIWQRDLPQSILLHALIDTDGDLMLEGYLTIDGNSVGFAKLNVNDGAMQWSLPQQAAVPPMGPYFSYRILATDDYVHVLELYVSGSNYISEAKVATYQKEGGQFIGRFDVALPAGEEIKDGALRSGLFGNGEILIGSMSNAYFGGRFSASRINPVTGQMAWSAQHPVMAPHPFVPRESYNSVHQMAWSAKGLGGVLIGGRGVNSSGRRYPRVAKIGGQDGRILWAWETDRHSTGSVAAIAVDISGDVILAGKNDWGPSPLLLAKLDGGNGSVIWESGAKQSREALDATLDSAGFILLMLDEEDGDLDSTTRVAKHSAVDGSQIWDVPFPQGWGSDDGENRITTHTDGSILAIGAFYVDVTTSGMQVAKIRSVDGTTEWIRKLPGLAGRSSAIAMSLADGNIIVSTRDTVWRINGATGVVEWQKPLPLWAWSTVLDSQGNIVVGGGAGNNRGIARINALTGATMWLRVLPLLSPANSELISVVQSSADGNILAASGDGYDSQGLAAIALLNGAILWQTEAVPAAISAAPNQVLGSSYYPVGVVEGPDRNVFFSGLSDPYPRTWNVNKVTGSFADGIFANGFD